MKILMVTMGLGIGGAETHIVELSLALKKRGHEVFVASSGGVYEETLSMAGISHLTLPLDKKTPRALIASYRGLDRWIRQENFDIVHAHARIPALVCGVLKKKRGFRFLTTDHAEFRVTPLLRRMTDWGDHTFAVSEDLKEYLLSEYGLSPDRISLTVNGVDTARFSPEIHADGLRESFDAQGKAVILHISRLDDEVSLCAQALILAMRSLSERAKLVIVGDGNRREALQALAKTVGEEAVLFVGARTDVERYLAAADVVAAPSRAAMEALASGKLTIVSGSQGHGGIFREEIARAAMASNFCFRDQPVADASLLEKEIEATLSLPDAEKEALITYGRAFIKEHYSVDRMTDTQLAVYENMMTVASPLCGKPDVLICGYYGYGNMGDENLLSVITSELRRQHPGIRITALSSDPEKTKKEHLVDAVYRFDIPKIMKLMKQAKIFLFGGGNLLQDKTSTRSLVYYTQMLHLAKRQGMEIAVFANGIGPVSVDNQPRVIRALSVADTLSLRDAHSYRFVKEHLPEKQARLVFDPAILQTADTVLKPKKAYFAVIPKKVDKTAEKHLGAFLKSMTAIHDLHPVVVSMYDGEDLRFAKRLAEDTGATVFYPRSAGELIGLLQDAECLISSRLHGLIYAAVAETPMISFSSDGKLASFLAYIGCPDCACAAEYDETLLLQSAERAMANKEQLRAHLQNEKPRFQSLVKEEIALLLQKVEK